MGEALRKLTRRSATCWILTDGKAGDEAQCLGVAEAMGLDPALRRVAPRPPFSWFMPRGPIDPREAASRPGSPIAPPYPDIVIASGRRAIPYLRAVKRASPRTFTVILKDPRTGTGAADLIWVPQHDALRGANVLTSVTAPHRFSASRLAAARAAPDSLLDALARPRAAILVGGDSRHHRFTPEDIARFVALLEQLAQSGVSLAVTTSRRTPAALATRLRDVACAPTHFTWDGRGANPLASLLAGSDAIVVTADSTNMVGEAVATGLPVLVFEPSGGHRRISAFLDALAAQGAVRPFSGRLEPYAYQPLDSTPEIAEAVWAAFDRHLAAVQSGRPES